MKTPFTLSIGSLLLLLGLGAAPQLHAAVELFGRLAATGPDLRVDVLANISESPLRSFCFRLHYDTDQLRILNATKNETTWQFHNGTSPVPYQDPDVSLPGQVLCLGAKFDARNPASGVLGRAVLLGSIVFQRLHPDIPELKLDLGQVRPFANFVTTEGRVLDTTQGAIILHPVEPDPGDQDLDGLLDKWEIEFFETTERVHYDQDSDGDGFNNGQEQDLGSDPTDPDSNLRIQIAPHPNGIMIQWPSVADRTYRIEASLDCRQFKPLAEGLEATPPRNSFIHMLPQGAETSFYRVVLE